MTLKGSWWIGISHIHLLYVILDRQHWVFSGLQGGALSDIRVSRIKFLPPGLSSMLQDTKKGEKLKGSVSNMHTQDSSFHNWLLFGFFLVTPLWECTVIWWNSPSTNSSRRVQLECRAVKRTLARFLAPIDCLKILARKTVKNSYGSTTLHQTLAFTFVR